LLFGAGERRANAKRLLALEEDKKAEKAEKEERTPCSSTR
jgi:hypothetical protein